MLAILDPVLPQLVVSEFAQAYSQLIASARTMPNWWMTCHDNSRTRQQICLQYMAAPVEENLT
jgi:hypothetical protein